MKKSAMSVLTVLIATLSLGGLAAAEGVGVDVSIDYFSKYVWRGQLINDDGAIQPGIELSFDKLTLGIWGNVDITDYSDNEWEFTEYDYYADYTTTITDGIDLSLGVINYYFPSIDQTTELYAGVTFTEVPLSPSITWYNDVDSVEGSYISFGVGHTVDEIASLDESTPIAMEIGASLGWGSKSYNKYYWGGPADSSSLNDLTLSVAFPFSLGSWTVTPSANYVTLVDSDVKDSDAFDTASDYFFTGIGLSTSF